MTRHISGTYLRPRRVRVAHGTSVRLVVAGRTRQSRATLLEFSLTDMRLTGAPVPALGTTVSVGITLRGRYLEFELPGVVTWQRGEQFGVSFEYLSARQTYGLALALDVLGREAEAELAAPPAPPARVSRASG